MESAEATEATGQVRDATNDETSLQSVSSEDVVGYKCALCLILTLVHLRSLFSTVSVFVSTHIGMGRKLLCTLILQKKLGSGWGLNPRPPEYRLGALTTEPLGVLWQRSRRWC